MNKKEKRKLIESVFNGNLAELKKLKAQQIENLKGKTIFAEFHPDNSVIVIAPCLGWTGEKIKALTLDQYAKLIKKYNFQSIEISKEI